MSSALAAHILQDLKAQDSACFWEFTAKGKSNSLVEIYT